MGSDRLPRKLAAILYADVAGYSRLTGRDEAGTHEQLSASLDLMADRIENAGGRIVHYAGDAVLADFDSVVAATNCAIGIQRAIAARTASLAEDRRLLFRIGINLGDVIVDRDDIYGDGVNVAARLEALAPPGGICISAAVHDLIRQKFDVQFENLGPQELKNIEHPVQAFKLILDSSEPDAEGSSTETISQFSAYSSVVATPSLKREPTVEFSTQQPPSIMILPFKNIGGGEAQEALVDGFRLSLQSVLVKLSGLFLVNAPVMEIFRDRDISAVQAGNEAGIRYVLEGAAQLAGNQVRLTVQLTDAPAAQIIWSERYDRELSDLFELQDEVTTEIVTALEIQVNETYVAPWWTDLSDWRFREKALRGLSHLYKGTRQENEMARREFEQLHRTSDARGKALALVALTHFFDAFRGWADSKTQSMQRATELSEKAVELGDPDGFGSLVLGYSRLYQRRHEEALSLSEHAATLRASCPLANGLYANVLLYLGRPDEAINEIKHAIRVQRLYPPWMANVLSESYRNVGKFDPSISVAHQSLRLDTENIDGRAILCTDYSLTKSVDDARQAAQEILRVKPGFSIENYAETKPYKESESLNVIVTALREAGLS